MRDIIGGPGIFRSQEYVQNFDMKRIEGYGIDTMRAEMLKSRGLKVGLGHAHAYQSVELGLKGFIRKYMNYGKGDYNFYCANYKNWTWARRWKSLTHIARTYFFKYPILAIKEGCGISTALYLIFSGIVRYTAWALKYLRLVK